MMSWMSIQEVPIAVQAVDVTLGSLLLLLWGTNINTAV